jgi:hypothetical protein
MSKHLFPLTFARVMEKLLAHARHPRKQYSYSLENRRAFSLTVVVSLD